MQTRRECYVCRIFLSTPSARRATYSFVRARRTRGHFYPRPPRGGRPPATIGASRNSRFLSTPSARRATAVSTTRRRFSTDFYPRPPRGGRPQLEIYSQFARKISIHALREEGDWKYLEHFVNSGIFLSTPSARRATVTEMVCFREVANFYPRPPRGGRQHQRQPRGQRGEFLSTPSARRATKFRQNAKIILQISIHALREEGDFPFKS